MKIEYGVKPTHQITVLDLKTKKSKSFRLRINDRRALYVIIAEIKEKLCT